MDIDGPIHLDSKGICFLCLRNQELSDAFSLGLISRFLKLNIEQILSPVDEVDGTVNLRRKDWTVSLCQQCSPITKRFTVLYQTLELTKLRLMQCMDKIHDLMTESENNSDRVEEAMERMIGVGVGHTVDISGLAHATKIANLRKEMITKCSTKMKMTSPRVQVKRLKLDMGSSLATQDQEEEPWLVVKEVKTIVKLEPEPEPQMPQLQPELTFHEFHQNFEKATPSLEAPTPVDGDVQACASSASTVNGTGIEQRINSHSTPSGKTSIELRGAWPCPYCRGVLSDKVKLDYHVITFHCEQCFLDFRDPSVSLDQFTKLVNHLLFKDQEDMIESYATGGIISCTYCPKRFAYNPFHKLVPLIMHMIKAHRQIVVDKVIDIQKDPDFNERLELAVFESDGDTCSCGSYVSSKRKLGFHNTYYCPNSPQVKIIPENSSVQLEESSLTPSNKTETGPESTNPVPALPSPRPSSESELASGKGANEVFHRKRTRFERSFPCQYCGATLTRQHLRSEHILRFHREHYFLHYKDPSITPDKFTKLVNHLLFKDQDDLEELQNKGNATTSYSCPLCDKTFAYHDSHKTVPLINHLINFHRDHVIHKLTEIQQDPYLNEKLDSAVVAAGGVTCSCGSYVPSENKLKIHKKHYCRENGDLDGTINNKRPRSEPVIIKKRRKRRRRCRKCGLLIHFLRITSHMKICDQSTSSFPAYKPHPPCKSELSDRLSEIVVHEDGSGLLTDTPIISGENIEFGMQDLEMEHSLVDPLGDT